MGKKTSSRVRRLTLLAASILLAGAVQAQDAVHALSLPSQPLDQALNALAGQTGSRILFATDIAENLRAPALNGELTIQQALQRLLQGSSLSVQEMADGSFLIAEPLARSSGLELTSVSISGKAPGSTTEGTGSYTTYSTSSAARLNLSPQETPQAITVMTRQRLDDQRLESLEDVLEATPGVYIQYVSGYGTGIPTIMARGSTLNSFQIDGVQASNSLQAYLQSSAIYDRVEIVKGATGLMNSLGSPAATVNMVRKRPTFEPQASFTAEAGNWERYGSGMDLSGPLTEAGHIRGRVIAEYKRQGAWVENFKQDSFTLYGIGELDISDSTVLTLGGSHITRDTQAPVGRVPLFYGTGQRVEFGPTDTANPSWTYYDHELDNAFVSIEHEFNNNWSGKAELNYAEYHSKSLYGILGTIAQPGSGTTISSLLSEEPVARQATFDTYLTGSFSLFGRDHELVSGITVSDLTSTASLISATYSSGGQYVVDYLDMASSLAKPDQITKTGESVTTEKQSSAYLSTRFSLVDSIDMLLGGRVTDWERDVDTETYSTSSVTARTNKRSGLFVPYTGLVYALDEHWSVYASYTKIFNPQQVRFLDINYSPIDPEEGASYEVGIKSSLNDGRLNASLAIYKTELDNRAAWYVDGGRTIYYGADGTTSEGVELELSGELAEGWQAGFGYSYNDIRDKDDERLQTVVPQHLAKTFTTYRLPGSLNAFTIGGGLDWTSKVSNGAFAQGSYAVANLMARYDINENLTASVNLNNVFDREYMSSYSTWGSYAPTRNVMTSIKYSF